MEMDAGTVINALVFGASAVAVAISSVALRHGRQNTAEERLHRVSERLYDINRIGIEHPEMQRRVFENRNRIEPYFHAGAVHDDEYFRFKSFIYMHINQYEEIVAIISKNRSLRDRLKAACGADSVVWKNVSFVFRNETLRERMEADDLEHYIVQKMSHPLFIGLYKAEPELWGEAFAAFMTAHEAEMTAPRPDDFWEKF
jgi:hypothetical protein